MAGDAACAPEARFVLGDARLTLADAADGSLDLIAVDAFSSDAIPIHLMTTEAIGVHLAKLKPNGAVLFHISNRNMELGPVVTAKAHATGLNTWLRQSRQTPELQAQMKYTPHVAMVAGGRRMFAFRRSRDGSGRTPLARPAPGATIMPT